MEMLPKCRVTIAGAMIVVALTALALALFVTLERRWAGFRRLADFHAQEQERYSLLYKTTELQIDNMRSLDLGTDDLQREYQELRAYGSARDRHREMHTRYRDRW
jgi:hypothetical protein